MRRKEKKEVKKAREKVERSLPEESIPLKRVMSVKNRFKHQKRILTGRSKIKSRSCGD